MSSEESSGENSTIGEDPNVGINVNKDDDTFIATIILGLALALVIFGGLYFYVGKKSASKSNGSSNDDGGFMPWNDENDSFRPPQEKSLYIKLKNEYEKLVSNNSNSLSTEAKQEKLVELKKGLMRRALKTIPFLYELQSKGPTADRLYKKGVFTDEMHQRIKDIKLYTDEEFLDVQKEAESLVTGWGANIWPQTNQLYMMEMEQKKRMNNNNPSSLSGNDDGEWDENISNIPSNSSSSSSTKNTNNTNNSNNKKNGKKKSGSGAIDEDLSKVDVSSLSPEEAEKHAEKFAALLLQEEEKKIKKSGKKKK